jgi:hypothetical protein
MISPEADNADEVSIKDILSKTRSAINYLKSKVLIICLFSLFGGLLGLIYSFIKKPVYTAVSTFVLEDGSKGDGLSQYAGLASLAGINVGGGGGGLFQGDNILELYKSRLMIEKTLLSQATINGRKQLLIDRYIEFNKLQKKWIEDDEIGLINFNGDTERFNRKQDSIITDIVSTINKKILTVSKLDKKLSIINVSVATKDETFSQEFNNKLVETVNDFYTLTKTKKSSQNVLTLQKQADSVKRILGSSLSGVASAIDATPNANPSMISLRVPSQKRQVDVQTSTAIYSEIVKNLEISKMALRQEAPLIQVIDRPVLPLTVTKPKKIVSTLIGLITGGILTIIVLLVRKSLKNILSTL